MKRFLLMDRPQRERSCISARHEMMRQYGHHDIDASFPVRRFLAGGPTSSEDKLCLVDYLPVPGCAVARANADAVVCAHRRNGGDGVLVPEQRFDVGDLRGWVCGAW